MIRIAIVIAIAYYSVGYALENPNQASHLRQSASNVVSTIYNKVSSLISGNKDNKNNVEVVMPQQEVTIHI